jgi:spermidine/putrescine transport system ATP-binding protein
MAPFALELREVSKHFGAVRAVDRVTLQVRAGEFLSLLGPSGCGKTTTLRMVAGFETPTAGEIYLDARPVSGAPPYRRNVNTVFQHYALFPHMTAFDNVAFGLRMRRLGGDEIGRRVQRMLELVELPGIGGRFPHQLSGGQQQRVALARALVNEPTVLLLDEPLGALDLKVRRRMQQELKRIHREVGVTFVYVTHDQEEALTMSDRVAVMNRGRIEQLGAPGAIYERPETRFTAHFIGLMNFFPGTVDGRDGEILCVRTADGATLRTRADEWPPSGTAVEVAVRPEKVRLAAEKPGGDENWLEGRVGDLVYQGVSTEYHVEAASGTVVRVVLQNQAPLDRAPLFPPGSRVFLHWPPAASVLLAASAGPGEAAADDEPAR